MFDTGRPYWATTFTASGTDQLWSSGDGINWRERPPLGPTFQSGTTSLYQAEFGLVAIAFANLPDASQTGNDQIVVGLSVDGGSWLDVSDVRIMFPGETPGNVGGSMGWSVVGDRVFVVRTFEGGQRTVWVGSFEG